MSGEDSVSLRPFNRHDARTLGLSALGGALEFYDFVVFVFFAKALGVLFFPPGTEPWLAQLQVYDNSVDAEPGTPVPDPRLLLQMEDSRITWPTDTATLARTPHWAKPILEAALTLVAAQHD